MKAGQASAVSVQTLKRSTTRRRRCRRCRSRVRMSRLVCRCCGHLTFNPALPLAAAAVLLYACLYTLSALGLL